MTLTLSAKKFTIAARHGPRRRQLRVMRPHWHARQPRRRAATCSKLTSRETSPGSAGRDRSRRAPRQQSSSAPTRLGVIATPTNPPTVTVRLGLGRVPKSGKQGGGPLLSAPQPEDDLRLWDRDSDRASLSFTPRPLINKLAACSASSWFSATFVVGSAVSSRIIRAYLDSSDAISVTLPVEVAEAALWLSWS